MKSIFFLSILFFFLACHRQETFSEPPLSQEQEREEASSSSSPTVVLPPLEKAPASQGGEPRYEPTFSEFSEPYPSRRTEEKTIIRERVIEEYTE
jgi:hypothetical protein